MSQIKLKQAKSIISKLMDHGFEAMIVGGAVRDHLMNKKPGDIDIATNAKPADVENIFKRTIPVGKKFGVMIVLIDDRQFEVATFRSDCEYEDGRRPKEVQFSNAKEDVLRRDFTINGLFWNPLNDEIVDFVGGVQDIEQKIIRAIGDPLLRFDEDYLRMLRAIRFAAQLNFKIHEKTWNALCQKNELLSQISEERIRIEFEKMVTSLNPYYGLKLLVESNLFEIVFDSRCLSNGHLPEFYKSRFQEMNEQLSIEQALSELYFFSNYFIQWKNFQFNYSINEEQLKLKEVQDFLKKKTYSNKQVQDVIQILKSLHQLLRSESWSKATLRQVLGQKTGKMIYKIIMSLELSRKNLFSLQERLRDVINEYGFDQLKPKPLVDGHHLLSLNVNKGPKLGVLLKKAYDYQLEHNIKDKQTILEFLKEDL